MTIQETLKSKIARLQVECEEALDNLGEMQDNCLASRGTSGEKRLKQTALIFEAESKWHLAKARLDGFKEASEIITSDHAI